MKLIKPSYEILTPINGDEILKSIEIAARTCYKSEDKIGSMVKCPECDENGWVETDPRDRNYKCERCKDGYLPSHVDMAKNLIKRGHKAMIEFGPSITVKFICDRGVSHELVRHRVASFAQESTRYCNYSKGDHITFIIPEWLSDFIDDGVEVKDNVDISNRIINNTFKGDLCDWLSAMLGSEQKYNNLIRLKWSPQQARSVLPNSLKTEINIKANIREWRHIFELRTAKAAHPQMRELMRPLLDEFKIKIPVLFDDIKY